jgi:hypothetical protein
MKHPTVAFPYSQKGGAVAKPEVDETRNEFFDKLIRKLTYNLPAMPKCYDGVLWYFFLLYNLEQIEIIGPFLSTALDAITLSLPVMADISEEVVGKLVSLAPVPYASFGGELLGYLISLIFVTLAVFMNIGRKHFGTAFKSSLEAIPFIGDVMFDAARSFEIGAKRYEIYKKKILKSVDTVSPSTKEYLNYYVPDSSIHPGPAPPLSMNTVKLDVADYVKEQTGLNKAMNKMPNLSLPTSLPAIPAQAIKSLHVIKNGRNVTKKQRK